MKNNNVGKYVSIIRIEREKIADKSSNLNYKLCVSKATKTATA